jgi:MarR family transcriptional regulator, organic hydroperoxide resistance regulator
VSTRTKKKGAKQPLETRVFVALLKAADALNQEAEQAMKSQGLTGAQYNVLRILRGEGADGLACRGIGERMISHDPDMTRLLDRMEKRGMITRERQTDDRRVVRTRITPQGMEALKKLDGPIGELHRGQFGHVAPARLKRLEQLLEEVTARAPK